MMLQMLQMVEQVCDSPGSCMLVSEMVTLPVGILGPAPY